jgi:Rps23 Pro-64 3,4-dihydroxylase Tpa1-like proline 4-hydroxylase
MRFKEYSEPSPHIIVDDFLTCEEYNGVRNEINDLLHIMNTGKVKDNRNINNDDESLHVKTKNNLNIWLESVYTNINSRNNSVILNKVIKRIWGYEMTFFLQNADSGIFRLYNITNSDSTLLSAYKNGGFYMKHTDNSDSIRNLFLTSNLMIGGNFKGGDFVLCDKTIPFKDNRLIIFESHREHNVTTVETDNNSNNWRYSIQYFAVLKKT